MSSPSANPRRILPRFALDAGWLFLVVGLGLLAAVLILPAQHDAKKAQYERDRAARIQRQAEQRLTDHTVYLQAAQRGDPTLIRALTISQLNLLPEGTTELFPQANRGYSSASIDPMLEAVASPALAADRTPLVPPAPRSRLERWTTTNTTRIWVAGIAIILLMIGVLPPAIRRQ